MARTIFVGYTRANKTLAWAIRNSGSNSAGHMRPRPSLRDLGENMKNTKKLTTKQRKALSKWVDKEGGQQKAATKLNISIGTLSRTMNGHTGPSNLLQGAFDAYGALSA